MKQTALQKSPDEMRKNQKNVTFLPLNCLTGKMDQERFKEEVVPLREQLKKYIPGMK